jgi:hypothetical protein
MPRKRTLSGQTSRALMDPNARRQKVSTLVPKSAFWVLKKYKPALIYKDFPTAFQAYDEGSIPFTRAKSFNHLAPAAFRVDTSADLGV